MLLSTQTLKTIRSLLRPHRPVVIVLIILGFLAALSEGIGIGLFIPFLQLLESDNGSAAQGAWLGEILAGLFDGVSPERRMMMIAAAIFAAVSLKALLTFASSFLFARLSARTGHELRTHIFEKVLTVDFGVLHTMGTGRILNILSNESWRTTDASITYVQAIITSCTFVVYLALLLLISWKLTIAVAILLILMAAAVRVLTSKVAVFGKNITRANAEVASKMVDGVQGIEVVRGYGHEEYERKRFAGVSERLARLTVRTETLSGAVYPVYEILAAAVLVAVLFTSFDAATGLAPLLVFIFVLFRLTPIVKQFEKQRVDLVAAGAAVDETIAFIGETQSNDVSSGEQKFEGLRDEITLDRVSYRYQADASPAVRDVSLRIPVTGLTAIVGPSGGGKSTLIKLLLRFFDPTEGSILVDGQPLADFDLDSWRSRISLVPQKVFLFNATVRDNIAYGALQASDEQIIAAAKAAGAHDFVAGLPQGYDTKLGENGVEISGGEAQRVCLARALIREPDILFLDEATNALDSISEGLIQEALDDLRTKCSVVVVAHRLATIESADQILVMDEGKLVERGDHQELSAQSGLFAKLRSYLRPSG